MTFKHQQEASIIAKRWRTLSIFQGMDTVPTTLAQNEILDLLDYIAELELANHRQEEIIKFIDQRHGKADRTCDEPGIAFSEAVRRTLIDRGNKYFEGETYPGMDSD